MGKHCSRIKGGLNLIPLKILLRNFCAVEETEIDFTGLTLAGITGRNGASKSTVFIYAPLFSLYGIPRPGCSIDDMVKTGATDMLAQFTFEHEGRIYQTIRTRSRKGKGKSTCEFQQYTNGEWTSLSGSTIAETDAIIRKTIGIDCATFMASSLIMQNDVSNYANKTPGQRKQVLAQILGLDIYEALQQQAKAKEKTVSIYLEASKLKLEDLKTKLESLPDLQEQIKGITNKVTLNAADTRSRETELADAEKYLQELRQDERQVAQYFKELQDIYAKKQQVAQDIGAAKTKIALFDSVLEAEAEIVQKLHILNELRQQMPALEAKQTRLKELDAEGTRLGMEEDKLADEEHTLTTRINGLERELSTKDELKQASEKYQKTLTLLEVLDEKAEKHRELSEQLTTAEAALLKQSTYLDKLLNDYTQLEKKVAILADSNCINPEQARCKFLVDAQEAKAQMPGQTLVIEQNREALEPLSKEKESIKQQLEGLSYDSAYHAKLKTLSLSLRQTAEKYANLSGKEELLEELRGQSEALAKRIDEHVAKQDDNRLAYDALETELAELPTIRKQINDLEPYEKQAQEIPQAKANREAANEQLNKLASEHMTLETQFADLKEKHNALNKGLLEALTAAKTKTEDIKFSITLLQSSAKDFYAQQGALQTKLDYLTKDQEELQRLSNEMAPTAKELVRWQLLVRAFGKNGIPVLILENALPELERITNDILGQMSAGAHTLQFITQRDAKSKDSQIETLDILVSDWAGTRPFESFSGGEQTRISLAIRFALSELLANRAGSKIEWIIGDEVLSDQSPEFRDMTIEAIKTLTNRFKKILIISHIPEIQEAFDQKIILKEGGKAEVQFN